MTQFNHTDLRGEYFFILLQLCLHDPVCSIMQQNNTDSLIIQQPVPVVGVKMNKESWKIENLCGYVLQFRRFFTRFIGGLCMCVFEGWGSKFLINASFCSVIKRSGLKMTQILLSIYI